MRSGEFWDKTLDFLEICARKGADLLSIESTGGKKVQDEALVNADSRGMIFGLGVLGVRDMRFLWKNIVDISKKYNIVAAGDTACGFANTAMVLAQKKMISNRVAAIDRVASIIRPLQAHLTGAVGPTKDCAYEGLYIKAITGVPISMEGKTSACAHLSSVSNIASACCDRWSNESVQNVRLLSTYAPVVSLEQVVYDCRLMNTSLKNGRNDALNLQRLFMESDAYLDPQPFVLKPDVVLKLSRKTMSCQTALAMTFCSVRETLCLLRNAHERKELMLTGGDLCY